MLAGPRCGVRSGLGQSQDASSCAAARGPGRTAESLPSCVNRQQDAWRGRRGCCAADTERLSESPQHGGAAWGTPPASRPCRNLLLDPGSALPRRGFSLGPPSP